MPLLQSFTISLLDVASKKISIDFADPNPSDYETSQIIVLLKKHKKKVHIGFKKEQINYIVCGWEHWIEFLLKMGFRDTAFAVCEVLNDLEPESLKIDPLLYFDMLKEAKPINPLEEKSMVEDKDDGRYEQLKREELRKRLQVSDSKTPSIRMEDEEYMDLELWVIYKHPRDYPENFVARKFVMDKPTAEIIIGETLEEVREQLPPALTRFERDPNDDKVIVETWL